MSTYDGNDTFPVSITLPDDSAPPTAANMNPAIEALADRTVWLQNRTGIYRPVAFAFAAIADSGDGGADVTLGGNAVSFTAYLNNTSRTLATIASLKINDLVDIEITGTVRTDGSDPGILRVNGNDSGSPVTVAGAKATLTSPGGGIVPITLTGRYTVAHNGTLILGMDGHSSGGTTVKMIGAFSFKCTVWRSNA